MTIDSAIDFAFVLALTSTSIRAWGSSMSWGVPSTADGARDDGEYAHDVVHRVCSNPNDILMLRQNFFVNFSKLFVLARTLARNSYLKAFRSFVIFAAIRGTQTSSFSG